MKISKETDSYNDRRYGKPYIALCDEKGKAAKWGDWIGQAGRAGELSIDADPGDVVMIGQKDYRNSRKSAPDYYFVNADRELERGSKIKCVKMSRAYKSQSVEIDADALKSERNRLVARIAEIDAQLQSE